MDEEDDEEVLTKKTKLTSKSTSYWNEIDSNENYGFGKRTRRKNVTLQSYKVYYDSEDEYDGGRRKGKRSWTRRDAATNLKEPSKIEFLLGWKRMIVVSKPPDDEKASKIVTTKKIVDADLKKYGNDLQALFININWCTSQNPKGVKVEDFKKLDLNKNLMKNGIIFIWSEKEILGRLLKIMEEKGFFYIENFVVALLDASKAGVADKVKEIEAQPAKTDTAQKYNRKTRGQVNWKVTEDYSESISTTESPKQGKDFQDDDNDNEYFLQNLEKFPALEAKQIFYEGNSEYLKASKKVLMMFRRSDGKQNNLELRHQRTSDALFDLVDPNEPSATRDLRSKEYVYDLIETLLPKALYNPEEPSLKMMELWADSTRPREGWINICEK